MVKVGQYSIKHNGRTSCYDHETIQTMILGGLQNSEITARGGCSKGVVSYVRDKMRSRRKVK